MKKATIVIALCILLSSCISTKEPYVEASFQWYELIREEPRHVYGKDQVVQIWKGDDEVLYWVIQRHVNYYKVGDKIYAPMRK